MSFGPAWLRTAPAGPAAAIPRVALCVAFSGGADSTALLAALARLPRAPFRLRAIARRSRPAPARRALGARHCRRVARKLGVPLAVRRVRVARARGESLEAMARDGALRGARRALRPGRDAADRASLGRSARDGAAAAAARCRRRRSCGHAAARSARGGVLVRPLLEVPRSELRAWLQGEQLAWIEDPSNADARLRSQLSARQVLPPLLARWPARGAPSRAAPHTSPRRRSCSRRGLRPMLASARRWRGSWPCRAARARRHGAATRCASGSPRAARRCPIRAAWARSPEPLLRRAPDAQPLVAWRGARIRRHADAADPRAGGAPALVSVRTGPPLSPSAGTGSAAGAARCRGRRDARAAA